jgi:hypothetical protein
VNKNNSVRLALLKISWRDKKSNVQADYKQESSQHRKPGNHFACQWIEIRRRCESVPIYFSVRHLLKVRQSSATSAISIVATRQDRLIPINPGVETPG